MKLKLSRTAWLVLGIGVFVAAFATLFVFYLHCSGEQADLERSLAGAQNQFASIVTGKTALESRLAEQDDKLAAAKALLASTKASFPRSNVNIEYDELLADLAKLHNLDVLSMEAVEPCRKTVKGITFTTFNFEAEVSGSVYNILLMVDDIADDALFDSATVEAVKLEVPVPESVGAEPDPPSAVIKLVGYSYGGD
jgi:hypothetical protein